MTFKPGKSGNPSGRPKENREVKELARKHTKAAIERLAFWMASDNPKASVSASSVLLDRGWGKPTQQLTGEMTIRHEDALDELDRPRAGDQAQVAGQSPALRMELPADQDKEWRH